MERPQEAATLAGVDDSMSAERPPAESRSEVIGVLQLRALLHGDLRQLKPLWRKLRQTTAARIALRKCTSVGRYCRVEGNVLVHNRGTIRIGERVSMVGTAVRCELLAYEGAILEIGDRTFLNYGTSISAHQHVRIGARCLIGTYTNILDNNYHHVEDHRQFPRSRPVRIGNDVWIGGHVIILPGVSIGDGATVGAGAVVRTDVPAGALVVGNPAQIVERK
jgi:acetyltransferase-like isoleucine patch superfamily enzyme